MRNQCEARQMVSRTNQWKNIRKIIKIYDFLWKFHGNKVSRPGNAPGSALAPPMSWWVAWALSNMTPQRDPLGTPKWSPNRKSSWFFRCQNMTFISEGCRTRFSSVLLPPGGQNPWFLGSQKGSRHVFFGFMPTCRFCRPCHAFLSFFKIWKHQKTIKIRLKSK